MAKAKILFQTDDHPSARREAAVLGLDGIDPVTRMARPLCLSMVKTGALLDFAYLVKPWPADKPPYRTAHCPNNPWRDGIGHERCAGVVVAPNGVVTFCTCTCHGEVDEIEIKLHDNRRRCRNCGDYLEPKRMGRGHEPICVDAAECAARTKELYRTNAALARIQARREVNAMATTAEPKAKAKGKTPQKCLCGCGEMTKGGRFRPGHDAKYHSAQKAKEGKAKRTRKAAK